MAKCEEVIRGGGGRGENMEVGREVCLRKKKNDKKEKGLKKRVRKGDQKKKRTKWWELSHLVKF